MPDHALHLVSSREPTGLAEDSGETPTSADQALEVIKGMLVEALVSPPVLLEVAYAQAMRAEAGPAAL